MNMLAHHLRKDLRYIRWWMLLTLLVAAGILWFPTVPLEERVEQIIWLSLIRYGGWLMLFLTIGRMVQLDAPFRDGAFLRSRPAAISTLIASKSLTALVLVIPMAMLECVLLLMLDMKPGATSLLLIFFENLLTLSAIAAVGIAHSMRKECFGKWFSSALVWASCLGIAWFCFLWFKNHQQHDAKQYWSYSVEYLKSSRMIMLQIVALTGASAGILAFIRSRRHETISRALGLTAICAIGVWLFWPVNFVEAFVPTRRTAPKDEWPDQSKLDFSFLVNPHQIPRDIITYSDGGYNGLTYRGIRGTYRLDGLSSGWMTAQNSYESKLKLANGRVLNSRQSAWAPVQMMWILPTLGVGPGFGDPYEYPSQVDLADFNLADAANSMSGASLKGHLRIPIKRPVLLQRIPLRAGQSILVGNHRISITKTENLGDEISFNIVTQSPLVQMNGGWQSIWTDRIEYFVINAARGEHLDYRGGGSSNQKSGHLSVQSMNYSNPLHPAHERKQIPPDWLDGAELLIVSEEYGGTFSQPFEFPDINLSFPR